jgi:Mg2+/Co2+ transporter CorB
MNAPENTHHLIATVIDEKGGLQALAAEDIFDNIIGILDLEKGLSRIY